MHTHNRQHLCKKRRDFLKNSSLSILSFIALQLVNPFLLSCSKYSAESTSTSTISSEETGITYDQTLQQLTIPFTSSQGLTLDSNGGFVTIDTLDSNDIFVMLGNFSGSVVAYSSICPHANVFNNWSFSNNQFICNSHNSIFDSNGNFSSDSSTSGVGNLTEYTVTQTSSSYIIDLS